MQRNGSNNVYLSEIAQIYQPQTISSAELTEDGFLVYGANGIIGKYKDYNHKTEPVSYTHLDVYKRQASVISSGFIFFSTASLARRFTASVISQRAE